MQGKTAAERQGCTTDTKRHLSHLGGFDFVAGAAGPAGQVRQHLALLPIHARMHLAPPLLGHNGCWSKQMQIWGKKQRQRVTGVKT